MTMSSLLGTQRTLARDARIVTRSVGRQIPGCMDRTR